MEKNSMNREQFRTFLLLYAANADMKEQQSERTHIKEVAHCDDFDEIHALFSDSSDYECIQLIMGYRDRFFATPEDQHGLLEDIKSLFGSDGKYSLLEANTMKMLKKLIQ